MLDLPEFGVEGYFDYNATAPMTPAAMTAWWETERRHWQNPSSLYREAGAAKRLLEDLREELADFFGIDDSERVVFTSGATETNNAVIRHFAENFTRDGERGRVLVSCIEHPSEAAAVAKWLSGKKAHFLTIDPSTGMIDPCEVAEEIARGDVVAVSVIAANNETGVLQPWAEVATLCHEAGIPFHTDAVQWIGRFSLDKLGAGNYVTGSGHKIGGGKGAGFLLLPEKEARVPFHSLIGGPQENGHRAGTENLPAIAAMLAALRNQEESFLESVARQQSALRDEFEARMVRELGVRVLGQGGPRLWNTSLIVLSQGKNVKWLARLSQRGYAVSTGSACSAGRGNPSVVMIAMGLDYEEMGRVLRISSGPQTKAEEWAGLSDALLSISRE